MSEAERLTAFLLALQTSPAQRNAFKRDPEGVLRRFGLNPTTIAKLHRRDYKALWGILVSAAVRGGNHVATTVGVEKRSRRRKRKRT